MVCVCVSVFAVRVCCKYFVCVLVMMDTPNKDNRRIHNIC